MQHRGAYTRGYCDLTSWPPDIPVPVLLPGSSRFALELRFLLSPSKSLRRHYISPHTNTLRTPNSSDRTPPDLRYFFSSSSSSTTHGSSVKKRQSTRPQWVAEASVVFCFHSLDGPRTGRSYGTVASVVNSAGAHPEIGRRQRNFNKFETGSTNTAGPYKLFVLRAHEVSAPWRRDWSSASVRAEEVPCWDRRSRNLHSLRLVFVALWTDDDDDVFFTKNTN